MTFSFRIEYLLFAVLAFICLPSASAFGAGDIPDFAYLEGKAFRHGDIEAILEQLSKSLGSSSRGGGAAGFLMGIATAVATGGRGPKFTKNDVKRVYFGNWLRDYSQAVDIAGLSKLTADSLVTVISILGFMTFGYATEEFQVTADRLGTYLPVEHIDNPKGYGAKEGDPRQFHPKLRPPVDPRELEINQNTGMKNYMATEHEGWDTSTAHVRRVLTECINKARASGGRNGPDLFEAYRLLGTALHTLEDLFAHSNWCEISLLKMGHTNVFCHVGDNVKVNTSSGPVPPLVTGTFGGADFLHSLLGEGQDHLSESSVADLSARMEAARNSDKGNIGTITSIIRQLPIGGGGNTDQNMQRGEEIRNNALNLDPDKIAPQEVQTRLWEVLVWRDQTMRDISSVIEKIPGLEDLVEQLNLALMEYVYTTIEPFITPMITQVTEVLKSGSEAVINTDDQFEVWNNPDASDPSHSMLSKDHFGLILNEPAGLVAKVVVEHSVNVIVNAWYDQNQDPDQAITKVLECFYHPYYTTPSSEVQRAMVEEFTRWFGSLGSDQDEVISRLSKESVKEHKHVRIGSEDNTQLGTGHSGGGYQSQSRSQPQQQQQQTYGSSGGGYQSQSRSQPQQQTYGSGGGYQSSQQRSYGGNEDTTYGGSGGYGSSRRDDNTESTYGTSQRDNQYGSGGYGSSRQTDNEYGSGGYGSSRRDDNEYGGGYRSSRQDDNSYGGGYSSTRQETTEYGSSTRNRETESYGRSNREEESTRTYGSRSNVPGGGYHDTEYSSSRNESSGYGRRKDEDEDESSGYGKHSKKHGESRRHDEDSNTSGGYGGYGGGYGGGGKPSGGYSHGDSETFGAERLNINDDEGSGRKKKYSYGGDY